MADSEMVCDLQRELRDMKIMFAAAVFAAGGRVTIQPKHLQVANRLKVERWNDDFKGSIEFRADLDPHPPADGRGHDDVGG